MVRELRSAFPGISIVEGDDAPRRLATATRHQWRRTRVDRQHAGRFTAFPHQSSTRDRVVAAPMPKSGAESAIEACSCIVLSGQPDVPQDDASKATSPPRRMSWPTRVFRFLAYRRSAGRSR